MFGTLVDKWNTLPLTSFFSPQRFIFIFFHFILCIYLCCFQMVVYIVCFSLEASPNEQLLQIAFWLEFLSSALPLTHPLSSTQYSRWQIMIVGLRSDVKHPSSFLKSKHIQSWQTRFPRLPLFTNELFTISSFTSVSSIAHLLHEIESECSAIFQSHYVKIPSSYRKILEKVQSLTTKDQHFSAILDLYQLTAEVCHQSKMDYLAFTRVLSYFHATGHIVLLDKDTVCTDPQIVPKIAAKFISPAKIQGKLFKSGDVTLLSEKDIKCILVINDKQNKRLVTYIFLYLSL